MRFISDKEPVIALEYVREAFGVFHLRKMMLAGRRVSSGQLRQNLLSRDDFFFFCRGLFQARRNKRLDLTRLARGERETAGAAARTDRHLDFVNMAHFRGSLHNKPQSLSTCSLPSASRLPAYSIRPSEERSCCL